MSTPIMIIESIFTPIMIIESFIIKFKNRATSDLLIKFDYCRHFNPLNIILEQFYISIEYAKCREKWTEVQIHGLM